MRTNPDWKDGVVTVPNDDNKEAAIRNIATSVLGIETLDTRKSNLLDFYDIAVWKLRKALEQAFEAGKASAIATTTKTSTNE